MKYAVKIEETLSRSYIVEADSWEEARDKVEEVYDNEGIILTAEDFDDKDFTTTETFGADAINENDERLEYFSKLEDEEIELERD